MHDALHPSPSTLFPSSHSYPLSLTSFPHRSLQFTHPVTVAFVVFELMVIEVFPAVPGSHCSFIVPDGLLLTLPSPQYYILHAEEHPSPFTVFPSSHSSPCSKTPFPQTGLDTFA